MQERALTDKGLEVELRYYPEIRDGIKEGWVVHMIEAWTDGEPAGRIKISYIPTREFGQLFETPADYAIQETGRYLRTRDLRERKRPEEWSAKELRAAIKDSYDWMPYDQEESLRAELEALDEAGLRAHWAERRRYLDDRFERQHRDFRDFHLDKPLVDSIRVYGEDDASRYSGGKERLYPLGRDWLRQGVGTVLWEAAAIWMAEQGFFLWASGIQSDAAKGAWKRLGEKHALGSETDADGRVRHYLDGSQISLRQPGSPQLSDLGAAAVPGSAPLDDAAQIAHSHSV